MAELKAQDKDLIYALDIGTRSVVGVVGRPVGDRLKVIDVEMAEHGKRAMMDGQIDDIKQVGALARTVTERLQARLGVHLERVCVAAAGRALRTQKGSFTLELPEEQSIDAEQISRLEAGAVSAAEESHQSDGRDSTKCGFSIQVRLLGDKHSQEYHQPVKEPNSGLSGQRFGGEKVLRMEQNAHPCRQKKAPAGNSNLIEYAHEQAHSQV